MNKLKYETLKKLKKELKEIVFINKIYNQFLKLYLNDEYKE